MSSILSKLTFLALIFSSFTIWFSLGDYVRLNILFIFIAFVLNLFHSSKKKPLFKSSKNTKLQRFFILATLFFIFISFLVNNSINYQPKLVINTIGTFMIVFILYFYYSSLIENYLSIDSCIKGLAYGSVLLMTIIFVDSILVNFANIEIHNWFIINHEGNTDYFRRSFWTSPCSPCEEPGAAAHYLNVLIPFSYYYFKGIKRVLIIILYIFCLFSLFSSTGLATVLILALLYTFLELKGLKKFIPLLIILALIILYNKLYSTNPMIRTMIDEWAFIDKITLSGNTGSDMERQELWGCAISDGLASPIVGMGPGWGKWAHPSYLSTYLMFLGNYGIFAFLTFLGFWLTFLKKCFKLPPKYKNIFLFAFISCSIAAAIAELVHSFILWMLLPVINKIYNKTKSN